MKNNIAVIEKTKKNTIEITGTVLLSFASLAVAWCSYQSTIWNGKQVFTLAESNLHYRRAQEKLTTLRQQQEIDAAITINFMDAVLDNRQNRIDYFKRRARPELAAVLSTWLSMNPLHNELAPAHPLMMEDYKSLSASTRAAYDSVSRHADALWKKAQYFNKLSDNYILYTVIFSLTMFLGALATKFSNTKVVIAGMLFAGTIFLVSILLLFISMPVAQVS
jgi:hypothetical protein